MKGHDFIPQGDDAFLDWSRNFVTLVVANAAAWEVPQSEATLLQTQLADYEAKLVVAKSGNRGKFDIAEKNTAKKKLMHTERDVTKRRLAWNPNVTSAQRKQIGITDHDETHTPIPEPQTRPEFSFKVLDLMKIRIDFHDQGSVSRAIPYGDNGAVFCYTTDDAPVAEYARLTKSALLTHSPWTLNLPPEARGKTLSGALMWQNEKGERGNWSEIQSIGGSVTERAIRRVKRENAPPPPRSGLGKTPVWAVFISKRGTPKTGAFRQRSDRLWRLAKRIAIICEYITEFNVFNPLVFLGGQL